MKLHGLAIVAGAAFFLLLPWHPYPLSFVLKPSGILVLALIAFLSGKPLSKGLALGLLFGAGGDILLDINLFLPGLVSFLISHLIYIALFITVFREAAHRRVGTAPWLAGLAITSAALIAWLLPSLGDMAAPVVIYFTVITLMAAFAYITPFNSLRLPLGATLFLISDALIGITQFRMDIPASDLMIWSTYFAAQYLIMTGFLEGWAARQGAMVEDA